MFAATVFFAVWLGWDAKDLVWGLWISSLTLGYSFVLASALSMFFRDKIPILLFYYFPVKELLPFFGFGRK
jgi:hypothetical protein